MSDATCWFNNHQENSYSELITALFLFLAFLKNYKISSWKKYLSYFCFFFFLEEINYGQNFLAYFDLWSWEELNNDQNQWAIHTYFAFINIDFYTLFNIAFIAFNTYLYRLSLMSLIIPLLLYLAQSDLGLTWCLDGTIGEPLELLYASTFLLWSYDTVIPNTLFPPKNP